MARLTSPELIIPVNLDKNRLERLERFSNLVRKRPQLAYDILSRHATRQKLITEAQETREDTGLEARALRAIAAVFSNEDDTYTSIDSATLDEIRAAALKEMDDTPEDQEFDGRVFRLRAFAGAVLLDQGVKLTEISGPEIDLNFPQAISA